jgi:signal transduction histidine kinase
LSEETDIKNSALFILISGSLVIILFQITSYSYLLFHSIVELFSIVIAISVFIIGWNVDGYAENSVFRSLGIGYLFVGIIDVLHTLSYSGMGVFPGYDANLPTQLWIAARYVETSVILIAPILLKRECPRYRVVIGNIVISSVFISLIFAGYFPDAFIIGQGLTPFKVASEYIIVGILVISFIVYHRTNLNLEPRLVRLLTAAIIVTALSELSFTLYADVYSVMNMMGHFLKVVSFYFIYRAMIVGPLITPYDAMFSNLRRSEDALRIANKTMRHDIINELAVIQTSLELFSETGNDILFNQAIDTIERTIRQIQLQSTFEKESFGDGDNHPAHIHEVIRDAIKDSILEVSVKGVSSCYVSEALISVLRNLVRNIEQHSKSERIEITISDTKETCIVRVVDFGKGIPEEIQERIFDEGYSYGKTGRTGMGLFLSRKILRSYNGMISLVKSDSSGTEFEVKIPILQQPDIMKSNSVLNVNLES